MFIIGCALIGSLLGGSAEAKTERLGDFSINRATNHVTTVSHNGASYGFSNVKAWFNDRQNGHPGYYAKSISPGVSATRQGILYGSKLQVGQVIHLPGRVAQDPQVGLSNVRVAPQSFVVMSLDRSDQILIPTEQR
jgi:hypothetical protein